MGAGRAYVDKQSRVPVWNCHHASFHKSPTQTLTAGEVSVTCACVLEVAAAQCAEGSRHLFLAQAAEQTASSTGNGMRYVVHPGVSSKTGQSDQLHDG